jgi:acetyltransferase-like isoleucine patch superfamily enzyme
MEPPISPLLAAVFTAAEKWKRDSGLSMHARVTKASHYACALALAPWRLRGLTSRGTGTRVVGHPRIENHGVITLGDDVLLRSVTMPLELYATHGAEIRIGDGSIINSGASLAATRSITLGRRVFVGTLAFIMDSNFHDVEDRRIHPQGKPVVLEDDVWVGVKATILQGVRIGRGAVVGAHAVVTHDVPPFTVVAGIPARVVRTLVPRNR